MQQALLTTWTHASRVEPRTSGDPLLAYAIRVARNEAIHEMPRGAPIPVETHEVVEPEVLSPTFKAGVARCFEELPIRPRIALGARIEDGGASTDEELAGGLGMTKSTYQQNLHRARVTLQDCLHRHGIEVSP
jgi:RNA polymerase sigma-70 factor (ECF subfamily)